MNDRFSLVLRKQQPDCTPIWIMRQAGRYMPEYRKLRRQAGTFKRLYGTAELAAQATLLPLHRFALDAAIIFSDLLIVLDALGLELDFTDAQGPTLEHPIRDEKALKGLRHEAPQEKYAYLSQALALVARELHGKTPLIGFVGSPWTLAVYAVEGRASKSFPHIRKILYQNPKLLHRLLARLTQEVTDLATLQLNSGADLIQIFDSWAGLLAPSYYERFSLSYIRKLIRNLKALPAYSSSPVILFTKGCPLPPPALADCGADVLGLDWHTDLKQAFARLDNRIILQGNLDPASLYGDHETINREVRSLLAARPSHCHHIFNLGHGILPDTSPDKVDYLADRVRHYSTR